jgi:hypothetical protein
MPIIHGFNSGNNARNTTTDCTGGATAATTTRRDAGMAAEPAATGSAGVSFDDCVTGRDSGCLYSCWAAIAWWPADHWQCGYCNTRRCTNDSGDSAKRDGGSAKRDAGCSDTNQPANQHSIAATNGRANQGTDLFPANFDNGVANNHASAAKCNLYPSNRKTESTDCNGQAAPNPRAATNGIAATNICSATGRAASATSATATNACASCGTIDSQ